MALFYDLTFRGTIKTLNWAVITHWSLEEPIDTPALIACQTLAAMGYEMWDTIGKVLCTGATVLTKVIAVAYDEPTGFAELSAAIAGTLGADQICPEFVAKGFRQYRSNSDFRASTHRFPEVREGNNEGGSWIWDGGVASSQTAAVATWLGNPQTYPIEDTVLEATFQPVLIRRQFTTYAEPGHVPLVTVLDPPQISPVASASFYGITSQVSRKFIVGA